MKRRLPQPTTDSIDMTSLLSALADPVRRHLIRVLAQHTEPFECGVVAQDLELTKATLSHHWKVLREAGLTTTSVQGRTRLISIRKADIEQRFPGLLDAILHAKEDSFQK
ncbi:ArsR/SmtB family transcription factor [Vibrio salinus]|uniref:ArsR/SmtB family transcription factor n=1 Tax=Vibrio salinus TaxID=2899784 RepID=UPI001E449F38|nr:helix-turn-helix transcriptional regulator [Vibrio salinus]MCE0496103.1 ArsR family transcriptional regulator [Vibrio salinus]